MFRFFLVLALVLFQPLAPRAETDLKRQLETLTAKMPATVGVAVIIDGTETVTVNNDQRFPLMSVFKFHQALALADRMAAQGMPLETEIWVTKRDLPQNTWSPLRDARPEGNFAIPVEELLRLTLQESDNNACDILFDRICSVKDTEAYIHGLGIRDCAISATEADMHADLTRCRDNWTTPLAMARLLERFLTENILPAAQHDFIKATMIGCTTGANRLARPLAGTGASLGHKTGTSDRDPDGRLMALNDAGFVLLPDGRHYVIAVFIKDSWASDAETEAMIAEISSCVYRHINSLPPCPQRSADQLASPEISKLIFSRIINTLREKSRRPVPCSPHPLLTKSLSPVRLAMKSTYPCVKKPANPPPHPFAAGRAWHHGFWATTL